MLEINNSEEYKSLFPEVSEKKLSQLFLVCSCMLAVQTTNLSKCARRVGKILEKSIKYETAYSQLKRFFQTGKSEAILKGICVLVIKTMCQNSSCYLILDRTNWEFGNRSINLLVIGLLYRDIFIPLIWKDLEKKGNSNSKERLDLIIKLQCWWKSSGVKMPQLYIAGDREFIGYHWLRGLEERDIKFVMRIRANSKIELWYRGKIKDRKLGLKVLTRYLCWKQIDCVEAVLNSDYIVKLSAFKNDSTRAKAETIYIMTNMDDIEAASTFYRKRYKIEVCFKYLKSTGFNLEDLHVEGGHKVDLMFGILTLIYLMTIQNGIAHFEKEEPKVKIFKSKSSRSPDYIYVAKSIFIKGCELLLDKVFFFSEFCIEFLKVAEWVAKKLNPLDYDNYVLKKSSVQ